MRASLEVGGGREGGPHRFPERGPLVRALCDGPNDLYVTDSQRSVHPVQATEGVTEGCPLASHLFHLALRAMDERVSPSFGEVLNVGAREDSRGRVGTIRNPAQPSTIRHHQAPSAAGTIRHHQAAQPSTMRNPAPPCTGGEAAFRQGRHAATAAFRRRTIAPLGVLIPPSSVLQQLHIQKGSRFQG